MGTGQAHPMISDLMRGILIGVTVTTLLALLVGRQHGNGSGWVAGRMGSRALANAGDEAHCSWQTPRIENPANNPLYDYFSAYKKGPLVRKWTPYFDVYHRYFQKYRGRPLTFLEIGVQSGGSIKMWQNYFGDRLTFFGMDINPYCKELFQDPPQVTIVIADQGSREFWQDFKKQMKQQNMQFDIILDDGGHVMHQQITTFEEAWPLLKDGGVYITEDMSTSMDHVNAIDYNVPLAKGREVTSTKRYDGGYGKEDTWVTYTKQFADIVNGHYINRTAHKDFDPLRRTDSILSAAFYDQMVVLEKGYHPACKSERGGDMQIPIQAKLKDGQVDPEVLQDLREKLAASQQ